MTTRPIRSVLAVLGVVAALGLAACGAEPAPGASGSRSPAPATSGSAAPGETPSDDASDSPEEPTDPGSSDGAETSVAAAVDRFADFLHAIGDEDIDVLCEIAGPAAEIGEEQGFGSCEDAFTMTLDTLSTKQKAALSDAGVRESAVRENGDGTVFFPVECIDAAVTFTESDLSSFTMEYRKTDWFVIG